MDKNKETNKYVFEYDLSGLGSSTTALLMQATLDREQQRKKQMDALRPLTEYKQRLKEKGVIK